MNKFTANQNITGRSVCDAECVFSATVIKRTAKTVTITGRDNDQKRCKIHLDTDGNEYVFPYGQYSMAPIMRA